MSDGLIQYEVKKKIATITMDRPKKYNALIPTMIMDLCDALERARQDHDVRAIVLRGAGGNFCAGDDLHPEERFKYGDPDLHTRMKTGYPRLVVEIMNLRKPVIALVEGYAVGAGFDIALACDFRMVSQKRGSRPSTSSAAWAGAALTCCRVSSVSAKRPSSCSSATLSKSRKHSA